MLATSAIDLIALISSVVAVGAAVAAVFVVRRGSDAELKGDVNDLAQLVERISKEQRRERMQRVRRGEKAASSSPEQIPIPPGAENIPMAEQEGSVTPKDELRRRVFAARRV